MKHSSSGWAFENTQRKASVEREQNALATLEGADPAFARAITAKLVPDRERNPDVIRKVVP